MTITRMSSDLGTNKIASQTKVKVDIGKQQMSQLTLPATYKQLNKQSNIGLMINSDLS